MNKVLLVGCGHMGSALLDAWVDLKSYSFSVIDPFNFKNLKKKYYKKKIQIYNEILSQEQIKKFNIIIFAIKPQDCEKVLNQYKNFEFKNNLVIVSIVAGKKINFFKNKIKNSKQIVRIMPNMPALIGEGISCFVPNKNLSKKNKKNINELFSRVGETIWFSNEKEIDMATAISGSGPGYIFNLIESLENASQKIGFSKKISRKLILSTILGSAKLMKQTNKEPDDLVNSIAVKGGTTEAGVRVLRKNKLFKIFYKTFLTAYQRALKLGNKK